MAQGLLVLAINRATKFSSYFLNSNKTYRAKVQIGTATDTDDAEGKVIKTSSKLFSKEEVEIALMSFVGKQFQEPPYFSALKHKGRPMYKYAREGKFIKKEPREIEIFSIENYYFKAIVKSKPAGDMLQIPVELWLMVLPQETLNCISRPEVSGVTVMPLPESIPLPASQYLVLVVLSKSYGAELVKAAASRLESNKILVQPPSQLGKLRANAGIDASVASAKM